MIGYHRRSSYFRKRCRTCNADLLGRSHRNTKSEKGPGAVWMTTVRFEDEQDFATSSQNPPRVTRPVNWPCVITSGSKLLAGCPEASPGTTHTGFRACRAGPRDLVLLSDLVRIVFVRSLVFFTNHANSPRRPSSSPKLNRVWSLPCTHTPTALGRERVFPIFRQAFRLVLLLCQLRAEFIGVVQVMLLRGSHGLLEPL